VTYPLDETFLFEEQALHEATWERGSDVAVTSNVRLYSAREMAASTARNRWINAVTTSIVM
jgi:hypothetical protein